MNLETGPVEKTTVFLHSLFAERTKQNQKKNIFEVKDTLSELSSSLTSFQCRMDRAGPLSSKT